jgi:hypothetical protein
MSGEVDPRRLDPEAIDENIKRIKERVKKTIAQIGEGIPDLPPGVVAGGHDLVQQTLDDPEALAEGGLEGDEDDESEGVIEDGKA